MRRAFALMVAVVLTVTGVALAATNQYTAKTTFSSRKAGTSKKPVPVGIKTVLGVTEAGGQRPGSVKHYEFGYPGLRVNGKYFPTCTAASINLKGSDASCPKGSLVGTGSTMSLSGTTAEPADTQYKCTLKVRLYNAPNNRQAIFLTGGPPTCGVAINVALDARFVGPAGKLKLVYDPPAKLNHEVAGISSATTAIITNIAKKTTKVKGKTVGYYESIGGCKGGRRPSSIALVTEDGKSGKATTSSPCTS